MTITSPVGYVDNTYLMKGFSKSNHKRYVFYAGFRTLLTYNVNHMMKKDCAMLCLDMNIKVLPKNRDPSIV